MLIIKQAPRPYLVVGTWRVSYRDAIPTSLKTIIEGVEIPYLDMQTLIKSKSTEREQDKVDIQRLRSLAQSE